jgi:opacity protein-like surface antigen
MIQRVLIFCALSLSSTMALAQAAPSATGNSAPLVVGGYFSYFDAGYAGNRVMGPGAFIDWSPVNAGNLGIEGEGRWLKFGADNDFSEYNYLAGLRYRVRATSRFQPYAKFLVGAGEVTFPYELGHGSYFALAPGGGMDYVVHPRWRVRADYEYQFWLNSPGIPGIQLSAIKPNGVSVGLSYRIF